MEQSQIFELIRTLNSTERRELLQFSANESFNNGRFRGVIIPLFEVFFEHLSGRPPRVLEKKEVFHLLFPSSEYKEGKVEKVMVEAHRVLRSFLLIQNYLTEKNEFRQHLDFAQIVRVRGLIDRYQKILLQMRSLQDNYESKTPEYYFRQIYLEREIHDFESLNNQRKGDLNIPVLLTSLDIYYNFRTVELLNRFLIQRLVTALDTSAIIESKIENFVVTENYLKDSPILLINYEVFSILRRTKEKPMFDDVKKLFHLINRYEKNMDWEASQEFYTYLRNFCIMLLIDDEDQPEVMDLLHDIYMDNLSSGYLHYEGKLTPSRYFAVLDNALKTKRYEWANTFIEKYKNEIHGENETKDIYRFNKAHYLFALGKYEECLDHIPDTSPFNDYLLIGKRMELKALYETNSSLLPYKLDAFKMFLSRTSKKVLSENLQKRNLDFLNLLQQISRSAKGNMKRAEQVIKWVEKKRQAWEWKWLYEKAMELQFKPSSRRKS